MKKLKSIILCTLVVSCLALLTVGVSAVMNAQSAEMAANLVTTYELDTQQGQQILFVNYGSSDGQFEIADDIAVTYGNGQTASVELCGQQGNTYAYALGSDIDEDEISVTPPTLYFYQETAPITISDLEEDTPVQFNGTAWFSITGVDLTETDNGIILTVNIEAPGNRNIVPRYPQLVINGKEYGATTIIDFDNNSNFASGSFLFTLPSEIADLSDATITIENTLEKSQYVQNPVSVTTAHSVQTTTDISEYLN